MLGGPWSWCGLAIASAVNKLHMVNRIDMVGWDQHRKLQEVLIEILYELDIELRSWPADHGFNQASAAVGVEVPLLGLKEDSFHACHQKRGLQTNITLSD